MRRHIQGIVGRGRIMLCAVICGTTSCPEKRPSISTSCGRIPPSSRFWHCPCHPRILSAFLITLPVPLSCSHMALSSPFPYLVRIWHYSHSLILSMELSSPFSYFVRIWHYPPHPLILSAFPITIPISISCSHMALSSASLCLVRKWHYPPHFLILSAFSRTLPIPLSYPHLALPSPFPDLVRLWYYSPHPFILSAYGIILLIPFANIPTSTE